MDVTEGLLRGLSEDEILKKFKLTTTISINNMVLFNKECQILKYKTTVEIMEEFYKHRYNGYKLRKEYLQSKIQRECDMINNKMKFILYIIEDKLKVRNRKKKEICKEMIELGFTKFKNLT